MGTPPSPMSPPPPARRGGIESALLAPGVIRCRYRRAPSIGVSPFEHPRASRDASTLFATRRRRGTFAGRRRLAAAWTAARARRRDGAVTGADATRAGSAARTSRRLVARSARCARYRDGEPDEDRLESALDEEGLLEPARRAWSAARSSPDASPPPAAARVATTAETFEEDVAAIDAARRRTSALPAPLGITPPVCVAPEPETGTRGRRREAAAEETDERVRKQRRDFSFDLVTPTLSTTPEEEDEGDKEKENQTEEEEEGDAEVEENARRLSAKRSEPAPPTGDDGEESGYSAEAELTPSVRESLSLFGGGTQSQ